ncbi:hypothetical protein [Actinomyces polynesiensis]|uniref:hypothetical protein n=1 Tax=Actinomyces polynesiensis TaxID=1325934 RepID=UPI0005B805CA|nr:hypothetical protein [Actinomyces polynesiensis]
MDETPAVQALPDGALPLALGRHALALVARHLREHGVHQVAVPDHHCLTMLTPFQLEGMHVAHVRVGPDLLTDPEDLARTVAADPSSWAVLHCETFGAAPSPALAGVLTRARAAGATLVVDATHTWPRAPHLEADHVVVSLRKLTGLPDGAFVTGLTRSALPDLTRDALDEEVTRTWLAGDHDRAEELMDDQLSPVSMSACSLGMLDGLDLPALVDAHRRTARALDHGLRELGLTPVEPRGAHFCAAFRHPRGPQLVLALARAGVDGPVWWPRPRGWVRPWPDDLVTLPLDGGGAAGGRGEVGGSAGPDEGGAAHTLEVLRRVLRTSGVERPEVR